MQDLVKLLERSLKKWKQKSQDKCWKVHNCALSFALRFFLTLWSPVSDISDSRIAYTFFDQQSPP